MPLVSELTDASEWKTYINPIIKGKSEDTIAFLEGCLSVPNMAGIVHRPRTIILEAYDYDLEQMITRKLEGADSVTVQHEIDHLDGILFTDKVDIQNFGDPHYKGTVFNPRGEAPFNPDPFWDHHRPRFLNKKSRIIAGDVTVWT